MQAFEDWEGDALEQWQIYVQSQFSEWHLHLSLSTCCFMSSLISDMKQQAGGLDVNAHSLN